MPALYVPASTAPAAVATASAASATARSWSRARFRARLAPTRALSSTGSNGFGRKSSAPCSMQRTALSVSSSAEITITGMSRVLFFPLSRSSTAKPSSSGIMMSSSTRSGMSLSTISSALSPFSAQITP